MVEIICFGTFHLRYLSEKAARTFDFAHNQMLEEEEGLARKLVERKKDRNNLLEMAVDLTT